MSNLSYYITFILFISNFRINVHSLKFLKEVRKHVKAFYVGTDPDLSKLNSIVTDVVNSVLLKCRKLRREDQETSDWIISRIIFIENTSCW